MDQRLSKIKQSKKVEWIFYNNNNTNKSKTSIGEFGRPFKTVFSGHSIVTENQMLQESKQIKHF